MSEHRLSEVVIERPRRGLRISLKKQSGYKKQLHKLTQEATEDGLFRPYLIKTSELSKTKRLTDHLEPLKRYLHSKVGQPWNDVYSDLCQRFDRRNIAGRHLLDHAYGEVEHHVEFCNGIPYARVSSFSAYTLWGSFYVHPETGILCYLARNAASSKTSKRAQLPTDECVVLDRDHEYRKLDGVWYLITFADFPRSRSLFEVVFDVLEGPIFCHLCNHDDKKRYAAHKRRCNKQEIRTILRRISQQ
jgi:hypothetical protein